MITNNVIWFLVNLNRHKTIIPHCVHIRVIYDMVLKTGFRANVLYRTRPNTKKIHITSFSLIFSDMIEIYVKLFNI